jgi:hypothetical protein
MDTKLPQIYFYAIKHSESEGSKLLVRGLKVKPINTAIFGFQFMYRRIRKWRFAHENVHTLWTRTYCNRNQFSILQLPIAVHVFCDFFLCNMPVIL